VIELRGRLRQWTNDDNRGCCDSDWLTLVLLIGIPLLTLAAIIGVIVWLA
jgi:hypothetical protein